MKPHIKFSPFHRKWICYIPYAGLLGFGYTPKSAYNNWLRESQLWT